MVLHTEKVRNAENTTLYDVTNAAEALPYLTEAYCANSASEEERVHVSEYFKLLFKLARGFKKLVVNGVHLEVSDVNTLADLIQFMCKHRKDQNYSRDSIDKFLASEDIDFYNKLNACKRLIDLVTGIVKVLDWEDRHKIFSINNPEKPALLKLVNELTQYGPMNYNAILNKYLGLIPHSIKVYPGLGDFFQKQIEAANSKNITFCTPRCE